MDSLKTKITAVVLGISIFGLLAGVAFGQAPTIPGINPVGPSSVGGLVDLIRNIVRWVYIVFFILAVLFILFAAFTYLTSGGDATKVTTAKNALIYAAVAIAVALLAVGFETIIQTFLTTPTA